MTIGNSTESLELRKIIQEGDTLVSRRVFNLIIGGLVLWGLLLNYIIVSLFGPAVSRALEGVSPLLLLIPYLLLIFLSAELIAETDAIKSLLGYHLIVLPISILLCTVVPYYDTYIIRSAVLYTGIITLIFIGLGAAFPDFFLRIGRALLTALGILIIGSLIFALLRLNDLLLCWVGAGIFSLYLAFDWARCSVSACTADNAVDIAANLYLDIINLFLKILSIVARSRRRD